MNEEARPVVGVVGESATVTDAIVAADGEVHATRGTDYPADLDAVVAVGEHALLSLTDAPPSVPVLPVDAGPGVRSVATDDALRAIERLVTGEGATVTVPILGITVDDTPRAHALADIALLTEDPARISEYAVTTGTDLVSRFRADGVVVSTPVGSHGYARAVDAPVVAPDTGVVAVAPVGPFATEADSWVLPTDGVSLTVERDEAPVELLADDRVVGPVPPGDPVGISVADTLRVVVLPESAPPFEQE
jgi:NAD+ kinase